MMRTVHTLPIALLFGLALAAPASALSLDDVINKDALKEKLREKTGLPAEAAPTTMTVSEIPLAGPLTQAQEYALGHEVAGRLLSAYPLTNNASAQQYINRVGRYVALQSKRSDLQWTFGIIDSDDINAFSGPGGYIFVTRGLYALLQNEAELAAVLGHEIAHINEKHQVKLLQKSRAVQLGTDALLKKNKSTTVQSLAGTGAELYTRSLDKQAEFDCDRLGVQYAARAGYDPYAYLDILDRIGSRSSDNGDKLSLLLRTHPHPLDRINALSQAMEKTWPTLASGKTSPGLLLAERFVALPSSSNTSASNNNASNNNANNR